jgi:5-methyltetrahydrofolate--homocysteine methyltransferase
MLKRLIEGRWLTANGVIGLYPANTVNDDDIEIYTDETRSEVLMTWHGLRMQSERPVIDGIRRPNRCLADFIAPKGSGPHDTIRDHIGLFAVTSGIGTEKKEKQFLDDLDDYSAIMFKALADRLAEAFAERLHQRVRTEFWGYAADESLRNDELIAEKYRGIRPAPGYPACPDHTVKAEMFRVLQCADIGMALTESLAMTPAASVSGFYLAHPEATYFNVGKIGDDQLQDWSARSGQDASLVKRSLSALL